MNLARLAVLVSVATYASPTLAAPVLYEFNSQSELDPAEGWANYNFGAGRSIFADGFLTIDSPGFEEWALESGHPSKWWTQVDEAKGWWVEFRLRVDRFDTNTCTRGPGVWIHDGTKVLHVTLSTRRFGVTYPTSGPFAALDTTDDFHVYRVQDTGGGHVQLVVDGVVAAESSMVSGGSGSFVLMFGDLGGCNGGSRVVWDYFSYDTAAHDLENEDVDGDGITNDTDNCLDIANSDQKDVDGDRRGDVCDKCPNDSPNDFDYDGLCNSEDLCPNDTLNVDANEDGFCDQFVCSSCTPLNCPPECDEFIGNQVPNRGLDTADAQGCTCDDASGAPRSLALFMLILVGPAIRSISTRRARR